MDRTRIWRLSGHSRSAVLGSGKGLGGRVSPFGLKVSPEGWWDCADTAVVAAAGENERDYEEQEI